MECPGLLKQPGNGRERFQAHGQKIRFWAKELSELKLRELSNYAREKATELRRKARHSNISLLGGEGDALQNAVAHYRPRPYPGKVAFFSAAARPKGPAWDFRVGWQELVKGSFESHEVPGDHRSMLM